MVREEIRRAFRIAPEKLHVIYSGVDLEHFHPPPARGAARRARAELGCQPHDTLFAFVGSGFARKGLDAAIEALKRAANPSFWLSWSGRTASAKLCRGGRPAGRPGTLPRRTQDVRPLYAAADCLILPSRYDPFPNTVLESFAMER